MPTTPPDRFRWVNLTGRAVERPLVLPANDNQLAVLHGETLEEELRARWAAMRDQRDVDMGYSLHPEPGEVNFSEPVRLPTSVNTYVGQDWGFPLCMTCSTRPCSCLSGINSVARGTPPEPDPAKLEAWERWARDMLSKGESVYHVSQHWMSVDLEPIDLVTQRVERLAREVSEPDDGRPVMTLWDHLMAG